MTMSRTKAAALLYPLAISLAVAGCSTANPDDPYPAKPDPNVVRPGPTSTDVEALAAGLNDVGYRLFRTQAAKSDNDVVLSPLSIGLAFGMLDLGASDPVAPALDELFRYPVDGDARWSAFNTLEQKIVTDPNEVIARPTDTNDPAYYEPLPPLVRVANRQFHDDSFAALPSYNEALATWFGAGTESLPIRTDQEGSRKHINLWVEDKTEDLIKDLIPEGALSADTVMVLVNALYLKAEWATPFEEYATEDGAFYLRDGSTTTTPFMHDSSLSANAFLGDGYAAIELPYAAGDLSMLVVVPEEGSYDAVEAGFDGAFVDDVLTGLEPTALDLYFPKFESETNFSLLDAIEGDLGQSNVFGVVGLGGIGEDLLVSNAVHAAKIIVDEEGTEAAAATAIMVELTSAPMEGTEFRIDRPFLYVIRDGDTGAVLFVGRVLDPSA